MENIIDKSVGQIVAEDYRTAQIFKNHNIDFCCGGDMGIHEIATMRNLDISQLLEQIEDLKRNEDYGHTHDFNSWPLDLLADHIEEKHHRYIEEKIPVLKQYLSKLCQVHGKRHPELFEISSLFNLAAGELTVHMKKEELILFPRVRSMVSTGPNNDNLYQSHWATIQNPIPAMKQDHDQEGERFRQIAALSQSYTPPADACNTYRVTYSLLHEFEVDLHQHIHLENNILFPKAEARERELEDHNSPEWGIKDPEGAKK